MKESIEKIAPLKKITLSLEAGTEPGSMDLCPEPSQFEFIFGLGSKGLSPFEYELSGKREGDEITLHFEKEDIPYVFQHLIVPDLDFPDHVNSFYLRVRIINVDQADQRAVIKALAEMANCGEHCCGH